MMRILSMVAALVLLTACGTNPEPRPKLSTAAENRIRGQVFLAENGTRDDVTTTASGLQYRVIRNGTGPQPTPDDRVQVHYRGMFIDRKEFETSRDRGDAPAVFRVRDVVRGWQEAIVLMPVGAIWEIAIPSQLAYGLERAPERIGPNQTLIFEIELIGITPRAGRVEP